MTLWREGLGVRLRFGGGKGGQDKKEGQETRKQDKKGIYVYIYLYICVHIYNCIPLGLKARCLTISIEWVCSPTPVYEGRKDGRTEGRKEGRTEGRKEGRKGIKEGRKEMAEVGNGVCSSWKK